MALVLVLLFASLLVFSRFGPNWAAVEGAALIAPWLLARFIKRPRWQFPFFAFVMATLLVPLAGLLAGLWLAPWWCLVIALGGGVLIIAAIWPAQMRYYRRQQQSADSTGH